MLISDDEFLSKFKSHVKKFRYSLEPQKSNDLYIVPPMISHYIMVFLMIDPMHYSRQNWY